MGGFDNVPGQTNWKGNSYDRKGKSIGSRSAPPAITTSNSTRSDTENVNKDTTEVINTLRGITNAASGTNMSSGALAALEGIISGQSQDPLVKKKDRVASDNITSMQSLLAGLDPNQAGIRASGRTADLSRQLIEQLLPQIFGGAEKAGTGGNMAAQLLGQDAAIRTGEAQNRAVEESINAITQQSLQGSQILGDLVSGTSAGSERLMAALGISKGAVENKASSTTENTTSTTTGATKSAATGTGSTTSTQEVTDPLGWAQLSGANSGGAGDRALATFIAAGGDVGGLAYSPFDNGYGDYNRKALSAIQSMLGA